MVAVERWFLLLFQLLLTASVTLAQAPSAPPSRLIIDPNGILRPSDPLLIKVEGVPYGTRLRLRVLQDCNSDGRPETSTQGKCVNPLLERWSAEAGSGNFIEDRLDPARLAAAGHPLPRGRALWLRVGDADAGGLLPARFAIEADPCSFFATAVETFLGGDCGLELPQVLRQHRGSAGMQDALFEVRALAVGEGTEDPKRVPGTRGASGVAWIDRQTILFTAGRGSGEGALEAGLYRVALKQGPPEQLWSTGEDRIAVAPFLLGKDRYAFVEQAPGPQRPGEPADVASLLVLAKGEIEQRIPLPYKIHQLLATDAEGTALLALSLGVADNHPTLLTIALKNSSTGPRHPPVEVIGFDGVVYAAALREPKGKRSVVAFENTLLPHGWQLMWFDAQGRKRDLVKRPRGHDLLPTWRPSGGHVAYLAEVEEP